MVKSFILLFAFFMFLDRISGQEKFIHAEKTNGVIRVDGILDEEAWNNAKPVTGFINQSPVYGVPSSANTEVRVLYDNTAIYVGVFLQEDPSLIRRQFTPRDQEQRADVDYFAVFLDTYKDRQNAYQFLVTSRNVQSDARVSPQAKTDFLVYGDLSWDAVWESKVSFRKDGWVVEMKIPFYSIRFSKLDDQEWGIQFLRFRRRLNESSFWSPVNPTTGGFVNQFGNLSGLKSLVPPLRLSFSPYISGGYRGTPTVKNGYQTEWLSSGGMDVKYGISESFTLDATLIPDFGQVISDNVVNNITPFEVQFRENRPFFTEGTELFNKSGTFYSRRIGAIPRGYSEVMNSVDYGNLSGYSIIRNPSVTRLYNAIKFSGRTSGNLGIGIFNAIGRPESARLRDRVTGKDTFLQTEPLANYNIIVLDQAMKNRSFITFTNTSVLRSGGDRDANVTALDIALFDKSNRFGMQVSPKYSRIFDSTGGYDGFSNDFRIGKVSGTFQYYLSNSLKTARYDPNDLGFLLYPNDFTSEAGISYNIFQPTRAFYNQRYSLSVQQSYLFRQFAFQRNTIRASSFWVFKNFWDLTLSTEIQPVWFNDYFELRTPADIRGVPRKVLKKARNYFINASGSSDSRKKLYVSWNLGFAESPNPDDPFYLVDLGVRYRFSDRFTVTASYRRQHDHGLFGYSFLRDSVTGDPILARRQYTDVSSVISGTYNFTSRMNLTFRMRHFWNRIQNTNFYNVKPDGYWTERLDYKPSDYNTDFNAFNLDVFYTWDFRLGSRLIIGWKNWLGQDYAYSVDDSFYPRYLKNGQKTFSTPHGNEFTIRFIYFLNYQQFMQNKK